MPHDAAAVRNFDTGGGEYFTDGLARHSYNFVQVTNCRGNAHGQARRVGANPCRGPGTDPYVVMESVVTETGNKVTRSLVGGFILLYASCAWGWGDLGHRIICQLAFDLMDQDTQTEVQRLIDLDMRTGVSEIGQLRPLESQIIWNLSVCCHTLRLTNEQSRF